MSQNQDPSNEQQDIQPVQLSAEQIEQLQQATAEALKQERGKHEAKLEKELKALEKLHAKYATRVQAAAQQVGLDMEQMQAELSRLAQVQDNAQRQERMEQLMSKYNPLMDRVLTKANIDRAAVRDEVLKNVEVPQRVRVLGSAGSRGQAADRSARGKPGESNADAIGWVSE